MKMVNIINRVFSRIFIQFSAEINLLKKNKKLLKNVKMVKKFNQYHLIKILHEFFRLKKDYGLMLKQNKKNKKLKDRLKK